MGTGVWTVDADAGGTSLAERLEVTPIINAGGPNTKHSGSRPLREALDALLAMAGTFAR